ncbi:probable F-box protein At4g22030 [Gastrolobium bilobum]|uniref:probable F-box protein At4g22030 n=1 Tax=Gastrolobium bilobum TaxID=150636 RepID=UPI002AB23948|nr:probable F-box protein At4g22030 [Gastrolobium bilobum]
MVVRPSHVYNIMNRNRSRTQDDASDEHARLSGPIQLVNLFLYLAPSVHVLYYKYAHTRYPTLHICLQQLFETKSKISPIMASLASALLNPLSSSPSSSFYLKRINCSMINCSFSVPKASTRNLVEELDRSKVKAKAPLEKNDNIKILHDHDDDDLFNSTDSKANMQLYAVLEAVADRIEMHNNVAEQRDNWNTLLLNSINMITLTASTMAGVASTGSCVGASLLAMKLSSALLFSSATGMLLVMNKIQPSQLAEEQRNATRLFKQIQTQIKRTIAIGDPSEGDVRDAMERVLALDKAYPLPLLGAMLEKFPAKFEGASWWPKSRLNNDKLHANKMEIKNNNGWNEELETEMREVIKVVKRKDMEDYERLGNLVLKINKTLAISGPLLTGIAAVGSVFAGDDQSCVALVPVLAGALATVVNAFEHGGQLGMVFEMYRNCGGFFKMFEETIESTIEEKDLEKRENGELFEMKMALQLGRSVSQLRELASKSASYRIEGSRDIDEFASKLF